MPFRTIILFLTVAAFLFSGATHAQTNPTRVNGSLNQKTIAETAAFLNVEIVVGADYGWPTRLVITGHVDQPMAWLGLSFYPYNVTDPVTGGTHKFIDVKEGDFRKEIPIEAQFLGGSFEAALWRTKVNKVDSSREYDFWDKMFGFHVEDMAAYKSGLLTQLSGYR